MNKKAFISIFSAIMLIASCLFAQGYGILSNKNREVTHVGKDYKSKIAPFNNKLSLKKPTIGEGIADIGPYPGYYDFSVAGWSKDRFMQWFSVPAKCKIKEVWINFDRAAHGAGSLQIFKTNLPNDISDEIVGENGWLGFYDVENDTAAFGDNTQWVSKNLNYSIFEGDPIWGEGEGHPTTIFGDKTWICVKMKNGGEEPEIEPDDHFAIVYTVDKEIWNDFGRQEIVADKKYSPPYYAFKYYDNTDFNNENGFYPAGQPGWYLLQFSWNIIVVVEFLENSPPIIYPDIPYNTVVNSDSVVLGCKIIDTDIDTLIEAGVESAKLCYKVNDGNYKKVDMEPVGGNTIDDSWEGVLTEGYMGPGDVLTYYFEASDTSGATSQSLEQSFNYFVKENKLLAFYNDETFAPSFILPSYFKLTDYEGKYDVWTAYEDGPLFGDLVDLYKHIVQIDGEMPMTINDDVMGTWFANGGKHLFWSSQDWGYSLTGGRDTTFADDDWHNEYLGIKRIGPQDFYYNSTADNSLPFPMLADSGNIISGELEEFIRDLNDTTLALYYNPRESKLGFGNYIDAIVADDDAEICFTDTLKQMTFGVFKETENCKSVFLTFDQLGLCVKDSLNTQYYWPEDSVTSVLSAALKWFETPLKVEKLAKEGALISGYSLEQNYPNPFNPETKITYSILEPVHVRLTIYNILGQKIATLIDKHQNTGKYHVTWNAENLNSGVYFYRLEAGSYSDTKKMMLLH